MKIKSFFFALPGYWLLFEAINLSLFRSKSPTLFGLYSTQKAFAIIVLSCFSFVLFRLASSPSLIKLNLSFKERLKDLSGIKTFIFFAILCRVVLINVPCSVGEDIAPQVLSTRQSIEGVSIAPNFLSSPDSSNLSANNSKWIPRPPGGSLIPLPGLLLGLSLGSSIHIALFLLSIAFGAGWIKLASSISLPHLWLQLFAILLAIIASLGSLSLTTGSVFTSATFPWLLIWSLNLGDRWIRPKQKLKISLISLLFFFTIGVHAYFKLSSLITVSSIAVIPFLIQVVECKKVKLATCYMAVAGLILFLTPYFLVSNLNQHLTGISSQELYSKQDYNAQHELWGKYFTESTRGALLFISLIASPGYASPIQSLAHNFRDLLLQFEFYSSTLHSLSINPRIFGCCILAIPFSILIFSAFWKIKESLPHKEAILYSSVFVAPFIGFAYVSFHHGYNYLIYHAYSKEFSVIFFIFALQYLTLPRKSVKNKFIGKILVAFFLAFPFISYGKIYCSTFFNSISQSNLSTYETQQRLGPCKFSDSLQLISADSKSSLDVCLFICAGSQDDYSLRTPMRSISLHFAKGNLIHLPKFKTSVPINVYCLFDPLLATDSSLIKSVQDKFSNLARSQKLDALTWKIELKDT